MTTTRRTILAAAFAPLLLPLRKLFAREPVELARRPGPWDCRCLSDEEYGRALRRIADETMRAAKAMTPVYTSAETERELREINERIETMYRS